MNAMLMIVKYSSIYGDESEGADHGILAIFSSSALAAKTTLIPLDITHQFLATHEVRQALLFGHDTSHHQERITQSVSNVRQLFSEIVQFFAKTYAEVFNFTMGPPTHDPLAVFAAFLPNLFRFHTVCYILSFEPGPTYWNRFAPRPMEHGWSNDNALTNKQVSSEWPRTDRTVSSLG